MSSSSSIEPRRYLIAIGSPHCPGIGLSNLSCIGSDIQQITNLFEEQGYQRVLSEQIPIGATSQRIKEAIVGWFSSQDRRASDYVVIYYGGHGDEGGRFGQHYLFTVESLEDQLLTTAIETKELVKGFFQGDRTPQNILLILDTCYANAGGRQISQMLSDLKGAAPEGSGFWLISSSDSNTEAGDGAFVEALCTVMQPDRKEFQQDGKIISISALVGRINQHFKNTQKAQRAVVDSMGAQQQTVFIRNPRFLAFNRSASEENQGQRQLSIEADLKSLVSPDQLIEGTYPSNIVARMGADGELQEDPRSTHLVIAVFWQDRSKQKCRVQPKLCYRDAETHKILHTPLEEVLQMQEDNRSEDNCSIVLKEFPGILKKLVNFTTQKLSQLFPEPLCPWKLTIELFVPIDLLSSSLSQWCGQNSELLTTHPIVIGCSDRFDSSRDPDRRGESANLYNQLRRGWQRFQRKIPDQSGSKLKDLDWLSSDIANQKSFTAYSGFLCYGNWLKSGKKYIKNWQELVRSGIPLALWMCEGQPQREALEATFDYLIDCTRFEFLDQIPMIRDEQRKTCKHCVGVFYEDPNYVPDVPQSPEEQFFSWPGT